MRENAKPEQLEAVRACLAEQRKKRVEAAAANKQSLVDFLDAAIADHESCEQDLVRRLDQQQKLEKAGIAKSASSLRRTVGRLALQTRQVDLGFSNEAAAQLSKWGATVNKFTYLKDTVSKRPTVIVHHELEALGVRLTVRSEPRDATPEEIAEEEAAQASHLAKVRVHAS